jgi:hypothetical protein
VTFRAARFFFANRAHHKRSQKKKLTIFGNTKQVIQTTTQYLTIRFPSAKMTYYGLRISEYRRAEPALCALARGSECFGAALVTGAVADEYNLNVVDCNASVTVARRSSISVSGGLGQPPEANVKDNGFPWPPPVWEVFLPILERYNLI